MTYPTHRPHTLSYLARTKRHAVQIANDWHNGNFEDLHKKIGKSQTRFLAVFSVLCEQMNQAEAYKFLQHYTKYRGL